MSFWNSPCFLIGPDVPPLSCSPLLIPPPVRGYSGISSSQDLATFWLVLWRVIWPQMVRIPLQQIRHYRWNSTSTNMAAPWSCSIAAATPRHRTCHAIYAICTLCRFHATPFLRATRYARFPTVRLRRSPPLKGKPPVGVFVFHWNDQYKVPDVQSRDKFQPLCLFAY